MEFRILTEQDAQPFHFLRREALERYSEAFYRTPEEEADSVEEDAAFLRERSSPEDFVLGVFDGGTLVGMVGFVRQTLKKTRHRGHVWGTYVRPDYQGRGVATRMMEALIARAKELPGLEQIPLTVVSETVRPRPCMRNWAFKNMEPIRARCE